MKNFENNVLTDTSVAEQEFNQQFCDDVIAGLKAVPKFLQPKYFYDSAGDEIFQQIMGSNEYYPTDCELEIFTQQTQELAKAMIADDSPFDLIELGAGDAMKSTHLLRHLLNESADFRYVPIDISGHVINYLKETLPVTLPGLQLIGLTGEYFHMLKEAAELSPRRKVVLFLGSNIGNMPVSDAQQFCIELRNHLAKGDSVLMGVDLKKNPKTILAAYNDAEGHTRNFNLNLLTRINSELGANFDLSKFEHYPTYDPETGACKSYLISLADQQVSLCNQTVTFTKDEYIYMEISQKYTLGQTDYMASVSGFKPVQHFFDSKKWFVDAIWTVE
ncbi:L-histidine N(alpha)-methyltransferase [uncultured Mucilaginibacter sp.]|uniref:L-histidine N(alpha)-methyltransferase n=1 Tax=uncultured Mucilaginibacter sp. TaxID=797541 RepID=UPI0025E6B50D|nr:L-histidine N(alpha)-methyltransferase [uncultured Mucilaginibacter sp.]